MQIEDLLVRLLSTMNSILARLTSVGIKFDDEVQALLLISSLPDSWSETVTTVTNSTDPMDSLLRRFVISFLARTSEEGVLGNYLVNHYVIKGKRNIRGSGSKIRKKESVKDLGLLKCNMLELQGGEAFQESMPK